MAALTSSLIVLLDLIEAGTIINDRMVAYFRTREAAGEEVDMDELRRLADESDEEWERFMEVVKKHDKP